jgi:hypothetical protein
MTPEEREYVKRGLEQTKQTRLVSHGDGDLSAVWPNPQGDGWLELFMDGKTGTASIRETPEEPFTPGDAIEGQRALELLLALAAGAFIDGSKDKAVASRILRTTMDLKRAKGTPEELYRQRGSAAFASLGAVPETYAAVKRKKAAK